MDQEEALDWVHKIVDIRERRTFERCADDVECVRVSRLFGDAQCQALTATYSIWPLAPGRYRVFGAVAARVEQICGVTLDPIEQIINEEFDVEFRSGARRNAAMEPDFDALGDDEPEPIERGAMQVGRFICEIVASAIDAFPRADDAILEQNEAGDEIITANPFGVLAQLKNDKKSN